MLKTPRKALLVCVLRVLTWSCCPGVMGISLLEGSSCPNPRVTGTVGGDEGDSWTSDGLWEAGYGSDSDHAPSISPCQHDQTCSDTEQVTVAT